MAQIQDYEVLSIIGSGSFGTCFKVRNKLTKKVFVWKAIDYSEMDESRKNQLISEINLLKQLNHPNIVKYFNHINCGNTQTFYLIMECCEGGDLAKLILQCRKERCHFEEKFIWRVLYQLSKALQGCHSKNSSTIILHRDIKPANVFLDLEGNVKLGDFGLARILYGSENFAETLVGTPYYMSPELIKGDKYNRKSDIWSLGCLVYELCALWPPFTGRHLDSLSRNISGGKFNPVPDIYSADLQHIIGFMLNIDHGFRPTIEMILHHPTVVSNVIVSNSGFPKLIPNHSDGWFLPPPDMSSTQVDILHLDTDTTTALRRELFQSSPKIQVNQHCSTSDPSIKEGRLAVEKRSASDDMTKQFKDPNEVTQEIFNEAFRQRLAAIKNKESELKTFENELKLKEKDLSSRELQIKQMEKLTKERAALARHRTRKTHGNTLPKRQYNHIPYDASVISIEPNESVVVKTAAKLLAPDRYCQRKVSFKSPQKFLENIENIPPKSHGRSTLKYNSLKYSKESLEAAVLKSCTLSSSHESNKSKERQMKTGTLPLKQTEPKRKSFFSLFNINAQSKKSSIVKNENLNAVETKEIPFHPLSGSLDSNTGNGVLPTKWTAEHKRTAFEMLAVMNATGSSKANSSDWGERSVIDDLIVNNKLVRHDRKRQSMFVVKSSEDILCGRD